MADPKEGKSPPTWKLAIVKWLGLFPCLLVVAFTIEFLPINPPLPLKLLLETIVLVPLLNYVVAPVMDDLFEDWLYDGISDRSNA